MAVMLLIILIALVAILTLLIILKDPSGVLKTGVEKLSQIETTMTGLRTLQERIESLLRDEMRQNRDEVRTWSGQLREELTSQLRAIAELQKGELELFGGQIANLTRSNEERFERLRHTVEERLKLLQEENATKLDQMRELVDSELHATLEKRLGESFRLVSERLEQVHRGLGEMQALASSVGDLKRVLSNVKARGILGEIQLGAILEQILTPEQYVTDFQTKRNSNERVEFAIKLPGRENDQFVYLPVDAKFHEAHYQRLIEAYETGDRDTIEEAAKQLELQIKNSAKAIKEKYLDPPHTTDFAIMFLPVEGLYAEVLRRPGLFETLQREYRVTVTGPTTLAAFLNSLQMGFRTLAVEKRSTEIWELLGAVRTEFTRFGDLLDRTRKKLTDASNTIEEAVKRSKTIEKKLSKVQQIPHERAAELLSRGEE